MKTESNNGPICPFCGKLDRHFAVIHERDGVVDEEEFTLNCAFCKKIYVVKTLIEFRYVSSSVNKEYPDDNS